MKILWICHFSNSQVRELLNSSDNIVKRIARLLFNKPKHEICDYSAWISNGIAEFEKFKNIELHIISPHHYMNSKTQEFEIRGIHYHFFEPIIDTFLKSDIKNVLDITESYYKANRKVIKQLINKIKPDLIHMYGIENPYYSIAALDIDILKTPFIATLQTLMSSPVFKNNHLLPQSEYQFRRELERKILKQANYIGSSVKEYREFVWGNINPDIIFLESGLAIGENIEQYEDKKVYDFVYFSASIEKAADVAVEAFALACKSIPSLTLNIVGGSIPSFIQQLENRIIELNLVKNITFSGKLPTHENVLRQIQFSKFALLPLKIDHVSGTIREAMYSKIPVLTTRTIGTPSLNEKRQSVLISEQGDYNAMAQNMINLIKSPELSWKLKENGFITVNELWNNEKMMKDQVKAYQAIYDHHHFNKSIPTEIGKSHPILNETR